MNPFTIGQYAEAKAKAKELGINPNGKSKQVVVDLVNAKLAELAAQAAETPVAEKKEFIPEDYGFAKDQTVLITGRKSNTGEKVILTNRKMVITKASKKPGFLNGHLLHEKTNKQQKCEIAISADVLVAIETAVQVAQ